LGRVGQGLGSGLSNPKAAQKLNHLNHHSAIVLAPLPCEDHTPLFGAEAKRTPHLLCVLLVAPPPLVASAARPQPHQPETPHCSTGWDCRGARETHSRSHSHSHSHTHLLGGFPRLSIALLAPHILPLRSAQPHWLSCLHEFHCNQRVSNTLRFAPPAPLTSQRSLQVCSSLSPCFGPATDQSGRLGRQTQCH
jgi:hypothetical protein